MEKKQIDSVDRQEIAVPVAEIVILAQLFATDQSLDLSGHTQMGSVIIKQGAAWVTFEKTTTVVET